MEHKEIKSPSVVPRSEIPIVPNEESTYLEVRPVRAHEILSDVLPA